MRRKMHVQGFGGKTEGERQLGRPRPRWKYNIKIDLKEIRWDGMAWIVWVRIGTSGGLM
jgi:hypothetical protein